MVSNLTGLETQLGICFNWRYCQGSDTTDSVLNFLGILMLLFVGLYQIIMVLAKKKWKWVNPLQILGKTVLKNILKTIKDSLMRGCLHVHIKLDAQFNLYQIIRFFIQSLSDVRLEPLEYLNYWLQPTL